MENGLTRWYVVMFYPEDTFIRVYLLVLNKYITCNSSFSN